MLTNYGMTEDGDNFIFSDLDISNKGVDGLNKSIEEAKDTQICKLSKNGIPDPSFLRELPNLIHLDLSQNKVKNVSVFTNEELF